MMGRDRFELQTPRFSATCHSSAAYEIAAIVAVLEQKGILTQGEVLDQVKQLRDKSGKAR
jgi:hypothetical protein